MILGLELIEELGSLITLPIMKTNLLSIHWLEGKKIVLEVSQPPPPFFFLANNSPSNLKLKSTLQFIITNHLPI